MTHSDGATLRLATGLGLAALVAYGAALPLPFAVCVMAVLLLSKPGPPMPLRKGVVAAVVLAVLLFGGVLLVPVLENYAFTGVTLMAMVLYLVFRFGAGGGAVTTILAMAFALMPVAGVSDQALVSMLGVTLSVGLLVGVLVGMIAYAFIPDAPAVARALPTSGAESSAWIALRATLIVIPICVLALINPSLYIAAIMKTIALSQQVNEVRARDAGRELVGSTIAGALLAAALWTGLSLLPNLWMLVLWLMFAALWTGARMFGVRRTTFRPAFWSNALITALILLGPAIEDSASGKSVLQAALVRALLFVAIACYAWGMLYLLERVRSGRCRSSVFVARLFSGTPS